LVDFSLLLINYTGTLQKNYKTKKIKINQAGRLFETGGLEGPRALRQHYGAASAVGGGGGVLSAVGSAAKQSSSASSGAQATSSWLGATPTLLRLRPDGVV
jgi:hypothetical protein